MFGPLNRREDGTFVFATPVGNGHVPMIALTDLGFWARYTFDHPSETSGRDLEVASDVVGWDYLVDTFKKVTGNKAVVKHQTLDEWFNNFTGTDQPIANEKRGEVTEYPYTTWRQNFTGWWALYRDDLLPRDLDWIRRTNPKGHTLESYMRETKYTGQLQNGLLKNSEDGKSIGPNWDVLRAL